MANSIRRFISLFRPTIAPLGLGAPRGAPTDRRLVSLPALAISCCLPLLTLAITCCLPTLAKLLSCIEMLTRLLPFHAAYMPD